MAPDTERIIKLSREMFRSFVGVDLHQCTVSLTAVDPRGEQTQRRKISTKSVQNIEDWLLDLPRPSHLAVEACPFREWFIDRYRPSVDQLDIADATELANLRGKRRKSDRNDALDIARRLARGECPLGFIADEPLRQLRKRGRYWRQLSRLLARGTHSLKSMLHAANLRGTKFDSAGAHRWFLAQRHLLGEVQQQAFTDFLDIILLVERARTRLDREVQCETCAPRFRETITRLQTVPGIGNFWGCLIAAKIGPFERFPNADTLEYWAGMTPGNKESAGRRQSGRITKAGSATLRWALRHAALTPCHSDAKQEAIRQRLIQRLGKPRANFAMGRRLLRILFAMMRDGKNFERGTSRHRNAAANLAKARRKTKTEKEAA